MPWDHFDDKCPGCRPVIVNPDTRELMPDDHPKMKGLLALWEGTTLEQRRAWHKVTCLNSRDDATLKAVEPFVSKMRALFSASS